MAEGYFVAFITIYEREKTGPDLTESRDLKNLIKLKNHFSSVIFTKNYSRLSDFDFLFCQYIYTLTY